jgi:hypothetical protein
MANSTKALGVAVLAAAAIGLWVLAFRQPGPRGLSREMAPPAPPKQEAPELPYEEWARREFEKRHPGEKPLNWRIAAKAEEFRETRPMGRFVLDQNDCSDFVDAITDDALGAQARFRRPHGDHILIGRPIWDVFYWNHRSPLQPGDELHVRHSPWYPPSEEAPWHVAVIGTDGMAYDWTKLRSWSSDHYGRHSVEWYTRNSLGPGEVVIARLAPQYRYLIEPLPIP